MGKKSSEKSSFSKSSKEDFLKALPKHKRWAFETLSKKITELQARTHRIAQRTLDSKAQDSSAAPRRLSTEEEGLLDISYIAAIYNPQIMETELMRCDFMPGLEDFKDRFMIEFQEMIKDVTSSNMAYHKLSMREFDDMLRLVLAYQLYEKRHALSHLTALDNIHFSIPESFRDHPEAIAQPKKNEIITAVQDFTEKLVERTQYNIEYGSQYRALDLAQRRAGKSFKAALVSSGVAGVGIGVAAGIGINIAVAALTLGIGLIVSLSITALVYGYCRWKKNHMDEQRKSELGEAQQTSSWGQSQEELETTAIRQNVFQPLFQSSLFKAGDQSNLVTRLDARGFPETSLDEGQTDSGLFALQGFASVTSLMVAMS